MKSYSILRYFYFAFILLLIIASCEQPQPGTVELQSIDSMDGRVTSGGFASSGGGPLTGDTDFGVNGTGSRQFYSFALSSIPEGVTIDNATLTLYLALSTGTPFSNHGNVVVDHIDYDSILDGADYNGGTLQNNIGTIADNDTHEEKSLNVTAEVKDDISNSRTYSQFRLRFSIIDSDSDSNNDYVGFNDAEDYYSVGVTPKLIVSYK